ncbi:MAG: DUF6029 family protein [Candidatus Edwardsbacteria bacterium]
MEDTLTFTGINKRFFEYQRNNFEARVGNCYATFGSGLVLRTFEDQRIHLDRDFEGGKIIGLWRDLEGTALAGKPNKDWSNQREDLFCGLEVKVNLSQNYNLGGSYLRLVATGNVNDPSWSKPVEELFEINNKISLLDFEIYQNYARRFTWGKLDPLWGWIGTDNLKGKAFYQSINFSLPGFGFLLEIKNYRNFDFKYNAPPTCNRSERLVNNGKDEYGGQIETTFSPLSAWSFLVNASLNSSKKGGQKLSEIHLETKKEFLNGGFGELTFLFQQEKKLEAGIEKKQFLGPQIRFSLPLPKNNSASGEVGYQYYQMNYLTSKLDYHFLPLLFSLNFHSWYIISLSGEFSSKSIPEYENKSQWFGLEIGWDLSEKHQLRVRYSSERGGLVCSGGICRYEPAFKGLKISLSSRI